MKRRGCSHLDEIVRQSPETANLGVDFVRAYLTKHIRYEVGERELEGLKTFFKLADKVLARTPRSVQASRWP